MAWYRIDAKLARDIVKLAAPVIFAMLTQTAINLADTIMVARLPRSYSIAGQAAIGHSQIVLWLIGGFLAAISVGTQALTARRYGEQDYEKAGQVLTNSMFLAFGAGTLFAVVSVLATPSFFPLLNANPGVVRLGVPYCQLRMAGILSMVATASIKSFFDGTGRTYVHLVAAMVMNVVNILLNWFLIFGVGPFPKMYVVGAGLASLIASYVGLVIMLIWTFKGEHRRRFRYFRLRNLSARLCKEIARLSVQAGAATVFVMIGFGVFLMIVAKIDADNVRATVESVAYYARDGNAVQLASLRGQAIVQDVFLHVLESQPAVLTAAAQVIISILSLSFMSSIAFGTATATLVSQNLGARKPDLAARYGWESVKIFVIIMGVLGVVVNIWPDVVLYAFSKDVEVIEAAIPSLRLMGAAMPLIAVGLILAQALFGAGNPRYVMIVEMVLHVFCLMPLAYVLGDLFGWGLTGVWGAAAAYVIGLASAMAWKFSEGKWKTIKI